MDILDSNDNRQNNKTTNHDIITIVKEDIRKKLGNWYIQRHGVDTKGNIQEMITLIQVLCVVYLKFYFTRFFKHYIFKNNHCRIFSCTLSCKLFMQTFMHTFSCTLFHAHFSFIFNNRLIGM